MSTVQSTPPTQSTSSAGYKPSFLKRSQLWLASHFSIFAAVAVLLYLFLPVAYVFVFSFNDHGKTNIVWRSFTWKHWQDPCRVPGACDSLVVSLEVAIIATVVSCIIGTLMALALVRYQFRGKDASNMLIFVPMATPEIVMGASLLTIFVQGFANIGLDLGFWTIVIAHIMFCISFVVVTVRARILSLDPKIEEAAQDLYAGPLGTFWRVTFPLILPRRTRCGDVGILVVLRRLHHHQLRLRQRVDLPKFVSSRPSAASRLKPT
ncbi:MAG: ABC transporter permease [Marmoricola sp.]